MNVEKARSNRRRPIEDGEVPFLEAFGHTLRSLRNQAGLSQRDLAWLASISARHLLSLEHGLSRTRRSTVERIAGALASEGAGDAEVLTAHLVALAGPALAPESEYAERVAKRRESRSRTKERIEARAQEIATGMAVEMAKDHIAAWRATGRTPRR